MSESITPKISRDLERIRNAERLARALRPYLSEPFEPQCLSTPATARGRNKDKRICQLNAAYRYCLALEQKVHELYGKENSVPEEFRLVHSTIASNRSEFTPQLDDDIFQTPVQKNSLSNDKPVSSSVCSSTNIDAPVPTKRPSILSTISPIYGPQDHFIDDSTEIVDFAVKKRRVEEKVNFGSVSGSKSTEPDQLNNLEFRKHYFLRSTAIRIKNALSGVSGESEKCARRTNNRKTNSSTHSSSRSSSVTTTSPEIRDEALDVSSLQNIDHAQLLKVDLPQEQLNNLYNLATNDTKSNFNFD